jgi:O-antigen ligase
MTRRLAWVAIAVLAAYAVFIGGAWWGIYLPGLRLISVVASALVLATWAYLAWRDESWRPRSVLLPAIAASLASLSISTLFSRYPGISVEYLSYAVLLAALYLLLVQLLARDFFRRRLLTHAGGLFVSIVAIYLAFTTVHWATWLSTLGRLTIPPLRPEYQSLTFGNPSTVLTIVALLAVPLVASLDWRTRRGVAGVAVVIGLTAIVALVSGSRAGWLAIAVAILVGAAAAVALPSGRREVLAGISNVAGRASGRVAIVLAGAGTIAAIVVVAPAILRRLSGGGEEVRLAFVRIALELFAQSPIVGTGPGTWVIQRPGLTQPTDFDEYIPHAHNVYAQTLGELGILGAVAGIVLIGSLVALVIRAVRQPDPVRRRWGWATLIGLVYFAAHQVLDFYPNFPSILLAAALPVAYLDATTPPRVQTATRRRWVPDRLGRRGLPLGGAVLAVAVLFLGAQELPAMQSHTAVERANVGDWAAADAPARQAAAQDPRISAYLFTAGLTAAHAGDHAASAGYFRQVTLRDDLPEAWLNLAAEQVANGESSDAAQHIRSALRIGRQRPAIAVPAGELALRIGDRPLAVAALTAGVLAAPSFLDDPWWQGDPDRSILRQEVAELALAQAPPDVAWELALMSGDAATARSAASAAGVDPAALDFIDAWSGDEAAYRRLIDRCATDALSLQPLFWCARIEGRRGDVQAANDYRYLANAQVGGSYRSGAELRISTAPGVGRTVEGNPAIFWGTYTYRRFTPWDVLVPSLVHLGIA